MTAPTIGRSAISDGAGSREAMPGGIALSAALHVIAAALVVLGLPNLFRQPPPQEMPIAVQLVTIAPETRATRPNPFRPQPEAKPETPVAAPAPKPEPKPEPPAPAPEPPPSAAAPPPSPAPPPKPEAKVPPAPPPPPKPVEARTPPLPAPPIPEPKPKQKPEPPAQQQAARAEAKPEQKPQPPERRQPVPKSDPAAFSKLLKELEDKDKKDEPEAFDNMLKNLTKRQVARAEDEPPPTPRRMAALSPPSSQPKAPLGSELSASEIDLVRDQLRPCFNPPFGAKESPDLVADILVAMNSDGTVRHARILDTGRYGSDAIFRALADSGVRALKNPRCSPLRLPADRYELWKTFIFGVSTKDMQ